MISVIIPVFNSSTELKNCLDSLLKQTEKDLEIILINDGSEDRKKLLRIIKEFKEKFKTKKIPFKFFEQSNKGAPAARNLGFKHSRGEYVIFCDADVILKPEALKKMKKKIKDTPGISYVYSSFYWGKKFFSLGPFREEKLKKEPFIHSTSLIKRKDFPSEGWDEKIKKFQDWDLWLTMLEKGKRGLWINKNLFKVQTGKGTMSNWLPSFPYTYMPFL